MHDAKLDILLFEDDLAEANLIREMLAEARGHEFSVEHVRYLADGLALLKNRSFDCILVDLGLPDSQGLETALAVRGQAKLTPIGIVTILDDEELALKALQMDIQDYLIKGEITGALLVRSIRYAIQRKRIAEQLRVTEQHFRALVTASSEVLYRMSPDWRVMHQLYSQKFLASTETPSSTWLQKYIHPDDQQHVMAAIQEAIRTKGIFELEHRVRRADGTLGWTYSRAVPIMDDDGEIVEWFGAASDITERKQAEEAVIKSERKFSKIFHAAPSLIGISTLQEGRFIDVNETALETLGYRREEIIGRTAYELGLWGDEADRAGLVQALEERGSVRNFEMRFRGKTGETFFGLFSGELIDISGERYLLSMVRDITDRKQAEEALHRAHDELERQVEERTASLTLANQQLQREIDERERAEEEFHKQQTRVHALSSKLSIAEERERARIAGELHDQVGQRLLLAKMKLDALVSSGVLNGDADEINSLIDQSIQDIRSLTFQLRPPVLATAGLEAALRWLGEDFRANFGLQVDLVADEEPKPLAFEISSLLFQAVRELLLNVAKHSGQSRANVSLRREPGTIAITVEDEGIGFDVTEMRTRFARTGGFGLFNVEQRIEFLDGKFILESEPGKGTRVTIMVPVEQS